MRSPVWRPRRISTDPPVSRPTWTIRTSARSFFATKSLKTPAVVLHGGGRNHHARPGRGKLDAGGGEQAGLEQGLRVRDDGFDHQGARFGPHRGADVGDRALELSVGVALDGEGDSLPLADSGDRALGDRELDAEGIDAHDGGDAVALLRVPADVTGLLGNHAAEGSADDRILHRFPSHGDTDLLGQEGLVELPHLVHGRLVLCLGRQVVGAAEVVLGPRHGSLVQELHEALVVRLGSFHGRPRLLHLGGLQGIEESAH